MTKTESAGISKRIGDGGIPIKERRTSHHFRAEGPNKVGAFRDCCVNALGLMEPRVASFGCNLSGTAGTVLILQTRLKEIL